MSRDDRSSGTPPGSTSQRLPAATADLRSVQREHGPPSRDVFDLRTSRRRWLGICGASVLLDGLAIAGAPARADSTPAANPASGIRTGAATADAASAPASTFDSGYAPVLPGRPLRFPRDHGAHERYRLEWWYLTGWLRLPGRGSAEDAAGVQITFFRTATRHDRANPSRFAPRQLLFAHAALALPERGRLLHAQRAAREGPGWARASRLDTGLAIGTWSLTRETIGGVESYRTRIDDTDFSLALSFDAATPPLLQGEAGFSRKGPLPPQASYYYSRPQLRVHGGMTIAGRSEAVGGVAWLDHEWSSELLDARASGWDWVGLNLDDGSACTAFRIRGRDGGTLWSYGRIVPATPAGRPASAGTTDPAQTTDPAPAEPPGTPTDPDRAPPETAAQFTPLRCWTSPRTGTRWPVAMRVRCGARTIVLEPLFDDQELDARAGTGVLYWEGAVRASENGRSIGRGYLELTGYAAPMRL